MTLVRIDSPPAANAFTSLDDHQSQTPGSFFGATPVLHLHTPAAQLLLSKHDLDAQSTFPDFRAAPSTNGAAVNGDSAAAGPDEQVVIAGIDVWVTSRHLVLFSPAKSTGVSLPYPAISLHAIQRLTLPSSTTETQGLYMQLLLNDNAYANSDEDIETLEITLIPSSAGTGTDLTPIRALFEAVSACADLNPDPAESDEEGEEGAEDTMPGAGGWITADNMHEFTDADGNFIGRGALGGGAGTVHSREEDFEDAAEEGAGAGESDEMKWRRTEQ